MSELDWTVGRQWESENCVGALYDVNCGLFVDAIYQVKKGPFYPSLLVFYLERMLDL